MKDVEIQYYFPYFGPFLWTSKINPDISKYILEKGKEQKFNFRAYLAGQIKKEFLFDKKILNFKNLEVNVDNNFF